MKKIQLTAIVGFLAVLSCAKISTKEVLDGKSLLVGASPIDLLSPPDFTATEDLPRLIWSARPGVLAYRLQVSEKQDFSSLVVNRIVNSNIHQLTTADMVGVTELDARIYYWRIVVDQEPKLNSNVFAFHQLGQRKLYVNAASSENYQLGNKSAPFKTITAAAIQADVLRDGDVSETWDILVAAGTYTESIPMRANIRIFGGYEATNWTRDVAANTTTVNAAGDRAAAFLNLGNTHAATTGIDGLTMVGATGLSVANVVYAYNSGFYLTNNTIDSGPGTDIGFAATYGVVHVSGGNSTIEYNTILTSCPFAGSGGAGIGVYVSESTSTIRNNTLEYKAVNCVAGGSPGLAAILGEGVSNLTIENNNFTASATTTRVGPVIRLSHSTGALVAAIRGNNIRYSGKMFSGGVLNMISISYGTVTVENNAIYASYHTVVPAILNQSFSNLILAKNRIHFYAADNATAIHTNYTDPNINNNEILVVAQQATGIAANSSSGPNIVNNTICAVATLNAAGQAVRGIIPALGSSNMSVVNNLICTGAQGSTPARFAMFETGSGAPKRPMNNAFWDFTAATGFNIYLDYVANTTCGSGATCYNTLSGFETASIWNGGGNASGNVLLPGGGAGNPFANFPKNFSVSSANSTANNQVIVPDGAGIAVNDYIEIDEDGLPRQISAISGTSPATLTFSPARTANVPLGLGIRNWGSNNSNLVVNLALQQNSLSATDWLNVQFGGRNTANNTCGTGAEACGNITQDRLSTNRTAVNGGASNAGAAGYSIGAFERD